MIPDCTSKKFSRFQILTGPCHLTLSQTKTCFFSQQFSYLTSETYTLYAIIPKKSLGTKRSDSIGVERISTFLRPRRFLETVFLQNAHGSKTIPFGMADTYRAKIPTH